MEVILALSSNRKERKLAQREVRRSAKLKSAKFGTGYLTTVS
jgi:hypothetical protein